MKTSIITLKAYSIRALQTPTFDKLIILLGNFHLEERGRKLRLQFVGECSVDGSRFFKPVARTNAFNFAAENMKQSKK